MAYESLHPNENIDNNVINQEVDEIFEYFSFFFRKQKMIIYTRFYEYYDK